MKKDMFVEIHDSKVGQVKAGKEASKQFKKKTKEPRWKDLTENEQLRFQEAIGNEWQAWRELGAVKVLELRLPGMGQKTLLEALKGVFGLANPSRLWWRKFLQLMRKGGWVEFKPAPCPWLLRDAADKLAGALVTHVDDVLLCERRDWPEKKKGSLREELQLGTWRERAFRFADTELREFAARKR
jgi:hypothetical protein